MAWTKTKTTIAAGVVALIAIVTVSEIAHNRHASRPPTDSEIRQKIVGSWKPSSYGPWAQMVRMNPDGSVYSSFKTSTNLEEMHGTWSVENNWLIVTETNLVGMDPKDYGEPTQRYKIVQIGSNYWAFTIANRTNRATMVRM